MPFYTWLDGDPTRYKKALKTSEEAELRLWLQLHSGPWPDSSMLLVGVVFLIVLSSDAESVASSLSTASGVSGYLCHQVLVLAVAIH